MTKSSPRFWSCRRSLQLLAIGLLFIGGYTTYGVKKRWFSEVSVRQWIFNPAILPSAPSQLALWPLPNAKKDNPHHGVTHWMAKDAADGTVVDVFDFDFAVNPRLRWEIYDQDEDDEKPFDNHMNYWKRNVAATGKQLNATGRGPVVAAWNGAFFGYLGGRKGHAANHVSPVVLRGKAYFNTANHRWTFGVKYHEGRPIWKAIHLPSCTTLEREFDYAAGSVQCLIQDGKPLQVEPFPQNRRDIKPQPYPSTPQEAGHIPYFDHMRTSRASVGWSRDNRHLYLLVVKEPDSEGPSSVAFSTGVALAGGWTVADVQRFWISKGVWGAVNLDAGNVAQLIYRHGDGHYTMVPPKQSAPEMRIDCGPNWKGAATAGGAMMYFFVREAPEKRLAKG